MEFTIKPAKRNKKRGKGARAENIAYELVHCPHVPDHCARWECHQQKNDTVQALENEKLALAISVDSRIDEAKRLVTEIKKECDMEAFGNEPMSSSHAAFRAGVQARPATIECDCSECRIELRKSEVETLAKRLAVTQDKLAALREYRSKNDLEFLESLSGQATEYANRTYLLIGPR